MNRIQSVSKFFHYLFQFCFFATPVFYLIFWFLLGQTLMNMGIVFYEQNLPSISQLSFNLRLLGFMVSLISMGFSMVIFYYLSHLFKLYREGKIFAAENVDCIRKLGWMLILTQLVKPIQDALMSGVLTIDNAAGHHFIQVSFTGENLSILVVGLMIILVSWVANEGRKLQEQQALTV